jgi:hypothetical protein
MQIDVTAYGKDRKLRSQIGPEPFDFGPWDEVSTPWMPRSDLPFLDPVSDGPWRAAELQGRLQNRIIVFFLFCAHS